MDCRGVMLIYVQIDLNEVSFNAIPFSDILQAIPQKSSIFPHLSNNIYSCWNTAEKPKHVPFSSFAFALTPEWSKLST